MYITKISSKTASTALKRKQALPKSWSKAAGLARHKRASLERHLQAIRREWSKA